MLTRSSYQLAKPFIKTYNNQQNTFFSNKPDQSKQKIDFNCTWAYAWILMGLYYKQKETVLKQRILAPNTDMPSSINARPPARG